MKTLEDIKIDMNSAASASYDKNRKCLDDYEFAIVSGAMWKEPSYVDKYGNTSSDYIRQFRNKPKPEINKIFNPINRILGQKERLEMNAIIAPNSDEATEDDANLLQSLWRNDFQTSDGVEAVNNADKEAFFGGFGAYKVVAKYQDEETPNQEHQQLCIEPVMSAPSGVLFGPSLRKDKADCTQAWEIIRVNRKEIEEEYGTGVGSINMQMAWFDWDTDTQKDMYLAHYYEVVKKTIKTYDFGGYVVTAGDGIKDQDGNKLTREELKLLKESNDYTETSRKVKRCEYALISGSEILKTSKTPFKRVPIIPQYGYYAVINGIEYYSGEVAKRRDPQMFSNVFYSALLEILAAPQVEKPEYTPKQIVAHKSMRTRADIDNAAFIMSDPIENPDGTIAHLGPIGKQMPPQIGTGMATAGQQLNSDLAEMASTGNATVPSNASGDAIQQVNERQDDSFQPLMQNSMSTSRAACECWIDGAQSIYFSNSRNIRGLSNDGRYSTVETLQYDTDQNGNYGPYKNSARGKYTVQVKLGESSKSKKEAELETTLKMLNFADTATPQGQMLLNQAIVCTTGEGGEQSRKIARYQIMDSMLAMGIDPEPETEEEKAYVANKIQQMEAAKEGQQDPLMLSAQAQMLTAQAEVKAQENKQLELQIKMLQIQGDMEGKDKKLNSGLAVSATKIDQDQQRIDDTATNYAVQNAIKLAELEQKAQQDQNANFRENLSLVR